MDLSLDQPRIYKDTFVGADYGTDMDENLDHRIPTTDNYGRGQYVKSPFPQRYRMEDT